MLDEHQLVARLHRLLEHPEVVQRFGDGDLEIVEIDGFDDKIEGTAIHRRADILDIPVSGDNNGAQQRFFLLLDAIEQGETVHLGHVDVGQNQIDRNVLRQAFESLHPVAGEFEREQSLADLFAELLQDELFQIRFVIHNQDIGRHGLLPIKCLFGQLDYEFSKLAFLGFKI